MLGDLAGLQKSAIPGLGALANLDQDTCGIFNHMRHRLGDPVPAEMAGGDLQDHVFEIPALEQPYRNTTLTRAHAYRHAALFVEVSYGDSDGFPHPPGEGSDRHVTDNDRVDPAHRRHGGFHLQVVLVIDAERQSLSGHDAAKGCEQIEGMPLGIETRVGHLRNTTDAHLVQGPHRRLKIFPATALDRIATETAGNNRMPGVLVSLRSDSIVGTDFLADTTATTVVLHVFDLANNRYRREALLW